MKNLSKYAKMAVIGLVVLLPLVATVACSSLKPKLDSGIAAARQVSTDAGAVIAQAKALATTLPVSAPERAAIEAKIVQVEAIQKQADQYIAAAQGVENTLTSGVMDPTVAQGLSLLPYGSYAVTGVSLLLMVLARAKANGSLTDLTAVVKSWEAIGGPATPEQKATVAAVQGPATSAVVDSIKATA